MPKFEVTRYYTTYVEADSKEEALNIAASEDNFIDDYESELISE